MILNHHYRGLFVIYNHSSTNVFKINILTNKQIITYTIQLFKVISIKMCLFLSKEKLSLTFQDSKTSRFVSHFGADLQLIKMLLEQIGKYLLFWRYIN